MRRVPAVALLSLLIPLLTAATPARVLVEDPPLPGQPLDGWEALAPIPDSADAIDLDEAMARASATHPELRELHAAIDAARGTAIGARGFPNPTWELTLHERGDGDVETGLLGVGVELDLTDIALAPVRAAAAAPAVDAARLRADEGALRLEYAVRSAWFDHQAARAAWDASIRSVDAFAALRDTARAQFAAGNVAARDLVLREAAYEDARIRAAELELDVVATRETLARLVGAPLGDLARGLPALPATDGVPADLEEAAVASSLELRALDAEIRAARRTTAATRAAGLTPELGLFVEAERHTTWRTEGGIEVSVPLFSAGLGASKRARSEADALSARRDLAEIDLRSSARETAIRAASAWQRARHYDEVLVPGRDRALAETLRQYNAMQIGIDQLLDAWRARVEVEIGRADTLRELWTARAALDALRAGARVAPGRSASSSASTPTESGGH